MFVRATVDVRRRTHKRLPTKLPEGGIVKVGFPAGKTDSDTLNKAGWNHFGTRGGASGGGWGGPIPARPFLLNAVRANKGKYRAALQGSAASILAGDVTAHAFLSKLGVDAQGDVQMAIGATGPANAPLTVMLKGSSTPLIDTGAMRQAVTYEVKT